MRFDHCTHLRTASNVLFLYRAIRDEERGPFKTKKIPQPTAERGDKARAGRAQADLSDAPAAVRCVPFPTDACGRRARAHAPCFNRSALSSVLQISERQASRLAEGGALARGRRPLCFAGCCAVDTIPRSSVPQKPVPARPVLEPVCLVLSLPSSRVGASKRSLVGSLARAGRLPRRAFCCAGHTMPLSSLWPKPAPWCPCFCGLCSCKGGPFFSRPEGGGACQVATHGGQIAL